MDGCMIDSSHGFACPLQADCWLAQRSCYRRALGVIVGLLFTVRLLYTGAAELMGM
jgi:hypothetical protein